MSTLVTGSSGHLGEALVRTLRDAGQPVLGLDIGSSAFTDLVNSVTDREAVQAAMQGIKVVYHTATLHKPHVATHSKQDFIDTNIFGTLVLLEEAVAAGVESFVFTSTTSVFGDAMRPAENEPAVWVTEDLRPLPKNIYGVTKLAAEGLCRLFHRNHGLNVVVLRTSRFFPEEDDDRAQREAFSGQNNKANELLFRRADIEDMVSAHLVAGERAPGIGFGCYIISATPPFGQGDLRRLRIDAPGVVRDYFPEYPEIYGMRAWKMFDGIERVYVNEAARQDLGWQPAHDFAGLLGRLKRDEDPRSELARAIGNKGYHAQVFVDGPYPVE